MDLSTTYLGITLPHPLMIGASPVADNLDAVRRAEDAGAAAIVMRSLFEEQITQEAMATHMSMEEPAETFAEAVSYFPEPVDFTIGPDDYLDSLRRVKSAVGIPVMASLNGTTDGGWLRYAKAIEEAGADALELNLYYVATDPDETAQDIEERDLRIIRQVSESLSIPLAVKVSPFFTSFANFARRAEQAGAKGMVLFNRYYESDIDIDELETHARLQLSSPNELYLRLRWLGIVSAKTNLTFAVTGGVHSWSDAVKAVMCGADAVQMVSAVLQRGVEHLTKVRDDMAAWMIEREYESLAQMRGSMNLAHTPDPKRFMRANYMHAIETWLGTGDHPY